MMSGDGVGFDGAQMDLGRGALSFVAPLLVGVAAIGLAACSGAADAEGGSESAITADTEIERTGNVGEEGVDAAEDVVADAPLDTPDEEAIDTAEKQTDEPAEEIAAKPATKERAKEPRVADLPKPAVAAIVGNAAAGASEFAMCSACHTWDRGAHRAGPSLAGVVGRKSGTAEGFAGYSDGLKGAGIVWSAKSLDTYLKDPGAMVPGSTMSAVKVSDDQRRADLVAYIMQKGQ